MPDLRDNGRRRRPMRTTQSNAEVQVPEQWRALAASLAADRGTVMVVGAVDCGKTTLCWWLAEQLAGRAPTAGHGRLAGDRRR